MRETTKQDVVIAMLRQPEGATVDEVASVTGWQRHTVRGVFSGTASIALPLLVVRETAIEPPASTLPGLAGLSDLIAACAPLFRGKFHPRWLIKQRENSEGDPF